MCCTNYVSVLYCRSGVMVSLVVVNYLSIVTSCCVVLSSSNTWTYQCEKNLNKNTTIDILLELYIVI